MKEYLIGEKLSHSYSAYIHSLFGGKDYGLKPLAREELAPFLRRKEFDGLNVTIPYKKEVIPFLDGISPLAARIGAVNTVVNRNGRLFGDNTDYFGLDFLARSAGVDFKGKNVLILGTGGTSETAATLARDCGAVRVERVSRTGELDYQNVYARRDTEVIVNATPVGMFPNNGARALDLSRFPRLSGALDAIYNPLRTEFVLQAKALGAACAGGLFMLVALGARARELFDGRKRSDGEILAACEKAERRYENIVLVGMPGSGKSVIGRAAAKALGREFFDADEEIEKRLQKSIPEIFAERGEAFFRRAESEVVAELAKKSGAVISTGGGAVKIAANVNALKGNGRIFYLKRSTEKLARKGRPLSKDRAALDRLYAERKPLYEGAADETVQNDGTLQSAINFVIKGYKA